MKRAVIVSTARTGLAKSVRGGFNQTHGAVMGGHAVKHAIARAGIDPALVEDVYMGCGFPEGATGNNIARESAIWGGCPVSTAGITVSHFTEEHLLQVKPALWMTMIETAEVAAERYGISRERQDLVLVLATR